MAFNGVFGWTGAMAPSAAPFRPHQFSTKMEIINPEQAPLILITPAAYADILAIAQLSGRDEIGWLGTVQVLANCQFLIDRVFMVSQVVSPVFTKISTDGLSDLIMEHLEDDPNLNEKLLFWGHIHPGNSTSPSGQDNQQMGEFAHNDWFIRGIFGRQGRAEFTFYDYRRGVIWQDVPWQVHCPVTEEIKEKWRAEIDAKVGKEIVAPNPICPAYSNRRLISHPASRKFPAGVVGDEETIAGFLPIGKEIGVIDQEAKIDYSLPPLASDTPKPVGKSWRVRHNQDRFGTEDD